MKEPKKEKCPGGVCPFNHEDRPPEMGFMDQEDPFIEVDGKKELKDGGGMVKESVVEEEE